jgi:hypothetical protein
MHKHKFFIAIVTLFVVAFITACGSSPFALPEDEGITAQEGVTITATTIPAPTKVETVTTIAQTPTLTPQSANISPTIQPSATSIPTGKMTTPVVTVISDEPLLSDEQLSAMGVKENETVSVIAWPVEDEMILQVGYQADATVWRVSKNEVAVAQVPNLQVQEEITSEQAVKELQKYNEAINYAVVSPDGQWVAWAAWETLLVKQLGADKPPIDLLGIAYERFEGGSNTLVWSPDSQNIAYVVKNDNAGHYEIRISEPSGKTISVLPLWNTGPSSLLWSPDGQYLAFKTLEQPQSGINHIYLFRRDGNGLTQLTQHGLAKNPIHWSPTSTAIAYTHGQGDGSSPWLVTFEIH